MASFDEAIPPGQVGKVTAKVHTETLSGPVSKSITVTTNDAKRPNVVLTLRAKIVGSVEMFPGNRLALSMLTGKLEKPGRLLIRRDPTETGTLQITDLTIGTPSLRATVRPVTGTEPAVDGYPAAQPGDYWLEVDVSENPPAVSANYQVTFKTGLPREPIASVPVTVYVRPPINLSPQALTLTPSPDGAEARGNAVLFLRDDLAQVPAVIESSVPELGAELEPAGAARFRALIRWTGSASPQAREATLTFRFGSSAATMKVVRPAVAVPISQQASQP